MALPSWTARGALPVYIQGEIGEPFVVRAGTESRATIIPPVMFVEALFCQVGMP